MCSSRGCRCGLPEAIAEVLEDAGYAVALASRSQTALELLHIGEHVPDLVLLDSVASEIEAYALMLEMSKAPRLSRIPTVLLSATRAVSVQAPNMRGLLHKPVNLDELLAIVSECIAAAPDPLAAPRAPDA